MKTTFVLLLGAVLCAGAAHAETTSTATKHVQIRVHKTSATQPDKVHIKHGKFTVLNIGQQCAYDPKNDPSLYPCRDGGVCIRTSPTFGKCFSKEEAAQLQNANATSVDGSDDSDDYDDSESGSGSGSAAHARGPAVGDEDDEDENDSSADNDDAEEDADDEDEEDDSVEITTKPPAKQATKAKST